MFKDVKAHFEGRQALLWLQTTLAERVKWEDRAPRKRGALIYGWTARLEAGRAALGVFCLLERVLSRRLDG